MENATGEGPMASLVPSRKRNKSGEGGEDAVVKRAFAQSQKTLLRTSGQSLWQPQLCLAGKTEDNPPWIGFGEPRVPKEALSTPPETDDGAEPPPIPPIQPPPAPDMGSQVAATCVPLLVQKRWHFLQKTWPTSAPAMAKEALGFFFQLKITADNKDDNKAIHPTDLARLRENTSPLGSNCPFATLQRPDGGTEPR